MRPCTFPYIPQKLRNPQRSDGSIFHESNPERRGNFSNGRLLKVGRELTQSHPHPSSLPRPCQPSSVSQLVHLKIISTNHERNCRPIDIPVISTSPTASIAFSICLLLKLFCAFSSFLAFFPETGARGPLVGCITELLAVPLGFFEIPALALLDWTLLRFETLRCLFGTLGFPLEGILRYNSDCNVIGWLL